MSDFKRCHGPACYGFACEGQGAFCTSHWNTLSGDMKRLIHQLANEARTRQLLPEYSTNWNETVNAASNWMRAEARRKAALPPPLPRIERVKTETGPDGPAVGVHAWCDGRYVFFPPPPFEGKGICWVCGVARISQYPPLCTACARKQWGDRLFEPVALAEHGIRAGARAR